jgi:sulfopyruvate decarboxylase subunit beta
MKRTDCLRAFAKHISNEPIVVAVGGLIDEWHEVLPRDLNYYSGGMGLAQSIGLGLSIAFPERRVIVFDGDGAVLMNLGGLVTSGDCAPSNLLHLVFHNGTYESSGKFRIPGEGKASLPALARAAGVARVETVSDLNKWSNMIPELLTSREHTVVILDVAAGDRVPLFAGDKVAYRQRFQEALTRTD